MEDVGNYLLTQGVLGVACLVLGLVIIYLQRKIDARDKTIQELNNLLLSTVKGHSGEFHTLAKETTEVMRQNSQNVAILSEKIEVGRKR